MNEPNPIYPFPLRSVATGRVTLATNSNYPLSGADDRQPRIYVIITNRSAAENLLVTTANGVELDTIFPQQKAVYQTDTPLIVNAEANTADFSAVEFYINFQGAGSNQIAPGAPKQGAGGQTGSQQQAGATGGSGTPAPTFNGSRIQTAASIAANRALVQNAIAKFLNK